jgi:hypothetical protein
VIPLGVGFAFGFRNSSFVMGAISLAGLMFCGGVIGSFLVDMFAPQNAGFSVHVRTRLALGLAVMVVPFIVGASVQDHSAFLISAICSVLMLPLFLLITAMRFLRL